MYICLAIFWLAVGVIVQVFWTTLQPRMLIPIDRTLMAIIFFIMFSYCVFRWRLARALAQTHEASNEPPPPRPRREYDPTFDFSDSKDKKSEPEAASGSDVPP